MFVRPCRLASIPSAQACYHFFSFFFSDYLLCQSRWMKGSFRQEGRRKKTNTTFPADWIRTCFSVATDRIMSTSGKDGTRSTNVRYREHATRVYTANKWKRKEFVSLYK